MAPRCCRASRSTATTSRSRTRTASSATRPAKGAFREILDKWRKPLRELGEDPLGDKPTEEITQEEARCAAGEGIAGGGRRGAKRRRGVRAAARQGHPPFLEGQDLARHRRASSSAAASGQAESASWLSGAARLILKAEGIPIDIELIRHDPDEAGLLGAAHLLPAWMLAGLRRHPRRRCRRHQHPRRRRGAQSERRPRTCPKPSCCTRSCGGTATRT